jgi:hypothetical protein
VTRKAKLIKSGLFSADDVQPVYFYILPHDDNTIVKYRDKYRKNAISCISMIIYEALTQTQTPDTILTQTLVVI